MHGFLFDIYINCMAFARILNNIKTKSKKCFGCTHYTVESIKQIFNNKICIYKCVYSDQKNIRTKLYEYFKKHYVYVLSDKMHIK
jgi:hypothetical protein